MSRPTGSWHKPLAKEITFHLSQYLTRIATHLRLAIDFTLMFVGGGIFPRRCAAFFPSELAGPDDERVLEHVATFQVLEQSGDGTISGTARFR